MLVSYLISEGLRSEQIFKTGSHLPELIREFSKKIDASKILETENLTEGQYFLVSLHREENIDVDDNLHILAEVLNDIASKYKLPIIFSVHPRTFLRLKILVYMKNLTH